MNKRKRAINKAELIAVRAYTVVGNSSGRADDAPIKHYFPIGTRVTWCSEHDLDYDMFEGRNSGGTIIHQFVDKSHLI